MPNGERGTLAPDIDYTEFLTAGTNATGQFHCAEEAAWSPLSRALELQ